MKINYKKINIYMFYIIFFLQSFIDGYYVAHDLNANFLKALKYGFLVLGVILGLINLKDIKKKKCYFNETKRILLSIFLIFIISLILIIFNIDNSDISRTFELLFRFSISILYSFIILNIFSLDKIYNLMIYLFLVSVMGWFFEKGIGIFNIENLKSISFSNSSSAFESSYFAASSINCCAFFMYYRKKKLISIISFIFVLLTFKRPAIIFAIIFFILPLFINVNIKLNKKIIFLGELLCILITILWFYLLLFENRDLFIKIIGDIPENFTQGRNTILNQVLNTGYKAAGLGSTDNLVGHTIEMDLIQFFLETTIIGLITVVFSYISIAGRVLYAVILMSFHMLTCLTGSGLYNAFGWIPVFITLGCINYKKSKRLTIKFPLLLNKRRKNV